MKNPFRFWMTGGAAMILAALSSGGARALGTDDRPAHSRVSRYGIEETVSRIEASALRHGLPVLARLAPSQLDVSGMEQGERRLVIVLESSQGGTPVAMDRADGPPALLLSVVVSRGPDGATQVWFIDGNTDDLPEGMSPEVRHDLADLPVVVDEALAA